MSLSGDRNSSDKCKKWCGTQSVGTPPDKYKCIKVMDETNFCYANFCSATFCSTIFCSALTYLRIHLKVPITFCSTDFFATYFCSAMTLLYLHFLLYLFLFHISVLSWPYVYMWESPPLVVSLISVSIIFVLLFVPPIFVPFILFHTLFCIFALQATYVEILHNLIFGLTKH